MAEFDVLVTGGESRQGIVTIRSLARRGIRMFVVGESERSPAKYSRYVDHFALVPSALSDPDGFVESVVGIARDRGIPYIYPVTESSLVPLDARRSTFAGIAGLIAPPSSVVRQGLDKKLTLRAAESVGLPITRTLYPSTVEEAEAVAEEWGYPVIFKPQGRSNDPTIEGKFDFKVAYAHSPEELRSFLEPLRGGALPMMQDYAYGDHVQFCCFFEDGKAHSFFQDKGVRLNPLSGGVGTRLETIPIVPALRDMSIKLFEAMDWDGIGQAQFKGPGPDGTYRFIEVSVRLPASVGSAVTAGVDYPWMQFCRFSGRPVEPAPPHKVGVATRWVRGDTLTVVNHLLGHTPNSADPLPSRLAVLRDYLVDFVRPGLRNYIFDWRDPRPGFPEIIQTLSDLRRPFRAALSPLVPSPLKRLRRGRVNAGG